MAELPEGAVFAGHRIDGVAGRGGMGVVYRATHIALDHVVALKVIAPELAGDPRFRERFVRESRTAVSIRHPNVVQVRHAGEEDGVLFVTMDYIEGSDLRAVITAERRLEPVRVALIVAQVAAALDAAHERGLVHRDVKPGNVLIERRDGDEHVFLTDFGLTKRMSGATELTASGAFIGTLEYMAPEQIRGGELDARTDVYALGGVAFAALTGEAPYGRVDGDVAKLYAHLNDPVPRASERAPDLPPAIDSVLERAMAKKPDERHSSAGEFARALEGAASGEASAGERTVTSPVAVPFEPAAEPTAEARAAEATRESPTPAEPIADDAGPTRPMPRPQARRRLLGALAGLALVAVVVGAVALLGGGGDNGDGGGGGGAGGPAGEPKTVGEIPAGEQPVGVALDGDRLLVGSRSDGRIFAFRIDGAEEPLAEQQIAGSGIDFVVPGFGSVWAAGGDTNRVYELDRESLETIDEFEAGPFPRDILVTENLLWVTNRDGNSLQRIDPEAGTSVVDPVPGEYPRRLVRDGDLMWVSYRDSGAVQALDVVSGKAPDPAVDVGGEPHGLFVADGFLWIANTLRDFVQKVDLADPTGGVEEFSACDEPRDVEVAFGSVWVTCGLGKALVELDPDTGEERGRVRFESGLETLTTSESPDRVWVAGGTSGLVYEVDPGT